MKKQNEDMKHFVNYTKVIFNLVPHLVGWKRLCKHYIKVDKKRIQNID